MNGWFFWILASYSFLGLVSGVALGPEWLRTANSAGVHHATMIAPGVVFLGAAVIFRLAVLKRGAADAISRFFSLLGWSAVFGAAAHSGAGWLGRWPEVHYLWAIHAVVNIFTLILIALAFVATLRVSMASNLMVFKVPGALVSVASGAATVLVTADLFGATSLVAWSATTISLSAGVLWVAGLTPHKRKETTRWRKEPTARPS